VGRAALAVRQLRSVVDGFAEDTRNPAHHCQVHRLPVGRRACDGESGMGDRSSDGRPAFDAGPALIFIRADRAADGGARSR
jgi:hypothetical protein